MRPVAFHILAAALFVSVAHAGQPILKHVGCRGGFAHFTLTNPTGERLFLVMSCTRRLEGPPARGNPSDIDLTGRWQVEENRSEGLVIPLMPWAALNIWCAEPPGKNRWRVVTYLLRHPSHRDAAFALSLEIERGKAEKKHRFGRELREASNPAMNLIAGPTAFQLSDDFQIGKTRQRPDGGLVIVEVKIIGSDSRVSDDCTTSSSRATA